MGLKKIKKKPSIGKKLGENSEIILMNTPWCMFWWADTDEL